MPDNVPAPAPPSVRRHRIHLSTAENVGKIFEQDWVILIGCKDGDVHFVPWAEDTDGEALQEWLALLAQERRRRQALPITKGS